MIDSIAIINPNGEGVSIHLGDVEPVTGLFVSKIEGLGPPTADINFTNLASADGTKYNFSRANGRNIVLHVIFTYAESIEEVRLLTYKFFPIKKKIKFRITTENRIAEMEGYVESNSPDIFSKSQSATISIISDSPWFTDISGDGKQIDNFSDVVPTFKFSFQDPKSESPSIIFSKLQKKKKNTITYRGEIDVGFVLEMFFTGRVVNPVITCNDTNETFKIRTSVVEDIVGSEIQDGDQIVINTKRNEKSVKFIRGKKSYNILNALDISSTWFILHSGDNVFSYSASSGELYMDCRITSDLLLQGV